eukprot:6595697-Pyramimonas_sp.AAC.1
MVLRVRHDDIAVPVHCHSEGPGEFRGVAFSVMIALLANARQCRHFCERISPYISFIVWYTMMIAGDIVLRMTRLLTEDGTTVHYLVCNTTKGSAFPYVGICCLLYTSPSPRDRSLS